MTDPYIVQKTKSKLTPIQTLNSYTGDVNYMLTVVGGNGKNAEDNVLLDLLGGCGRRVKMV